MKMSMKRMGATVLLLAALFTFLLTAKAESFPFTGITTAQLRLRSGASVSSSVITEIPRGSFVSVTGRKNDFYIVSWNDKNGYASALYIAVSSAGEPTPEPVRYSLYTEIGTSSDKSEIRALQQALQELGFYTSAVDGLFGSGTQNAIRAFQSMNGLTVNGRAVPETLERLFSDSVKNSRGKAVRVLTLPPLTGMTIEKGSRGDAVANLQKRLKELGYYSYSADGECGTATVTAIKAFQKKMGLNETGKADETVQAILYSSSAISAKATVKPAATPTQKPGYPYTAETLTAVNLRKGMSTSTARILTVPSGASVSVLEQNGDYLRVVYKSYTGYLPAQYVDIPAEYLPGTVLPESMQAGLDYTCLSSGSTGWGVRALQQGLKELGFLNGAADGIFGSATQKALKTFQKKNGLKEDGIATSEVQQYLYEKKVKNSAGKSVYVAVLPPVDGWPMEKGDIGEQVNALQITLSSLGYYTGSFSNTYDSATENAVRAYQKAAGLYADGKAGAKTLASLKNAAATPVPYITAAPTVQPVSTPLTAQNVVVMRSGTRGVAVTQLQNALIALGYYTCIPDGIYDSDDIAAVKAFQKANGLKTDGIAGLDTQLKLYSGSAVPAPTPTPVPTPRVTDTPKPIATPKPAGKTATPKKSATPRMTATPGTTPAPAAATVLKRGSKGSEVTRLQQRLIELHYLSGGADGIFGSVTYNAVVAFQRANGLSADGIAGAKTQQKLYASSAKAAATQKAAVTPTPEPAALRLGSDGEEVKKLQQRLIALGYLSSTADGSFGLKTYSALIAFQQRNSLAADGVAGKSTLNKLYSSSAVKAPAHQTSVPMTPTPAPESAFTVPKASEVRFADWYDEIRSRARAMPDVVIYDPVSGLHYNLHMFSFGKHADAEPPTSKDTAIMYQVCGTNSWTPKAVWVIFIDGRVYMASTHSHGHEVDNISGNDLTGHICIHFPRDMSDAEATGPYAVSHQKALLLGWEKTRQTTGY